MNNNFKMPEGFNKVNREEDEPIHFSEKMDRRKDDNADGLHFSEHIEEIKERDNTGLFMPDNIEMLDVHNEDKKLRIVRR